MSHQNTIVDLTAIEFEAKLLQSGYLRFRPRRQFPGTTLRWYARNQRRGDGVRILERIAVNDIVGLRFERIGGKGFLNMVEFVHFKPGPT